MISPTGKKPVGKKEKEVFKSGYRFARFFNRWGEEADGQAAGKGRREDARKWRGGLQWANSFDGMPMQVQANDAERRGEGEVWGRCKEDFFGYLQFLQRV